jgi:predicted metal-dependent phosphoesterase TrpH
MIDLHTHTTASDGSLTPTQLLAHAKEVGLSALAVTDHDTVSGVAEAKAAGAEHGIEVIAGCELSTGEGKQSMHIVGLFLPDNPTKLQESLDFVLNARMNRNQLIVDKLNELGVDITLDEIKAEAQGTVGRPHFAKVLLAKGVVNSIQQAFDVWIGNEGKAYIPRTRLTPAQAIDILKAEGATPILAHPYILGLKPHEMDARVAELAELGLEGIEAFYTEHSDSQTEQYKGLAKKYGLVVSGGSDFHGTPKPHVLLGKGRGGLRVPDQVLVNLKAHRQAKGLPI